MELSNVTHSRGVEIDELDTVEFAVDDLKDIAQAGDALASIPGIEGKV